MLNLSIRAIIFDLLEAELPKLRWAKPLRFFLIAIILVNVMAVILESVPELEKKYTFIFWTIEIFSVVIFSVEYVLRLWVAPEANPIAAQHPIRSRIYFASKPLALIDLLAILPFYLSSFLMLDLRMLRVLRLLRLIKLVRYFRGINLLTEVFRAEFIPLVAAILVMTVVMVLAASGMYLVEQDVQPQAFGSIPAAMWWAIVTLTAVGYGDVVPMTLAGKMIGTVIMLLGVGMIALPAGMLASRFSEELRRHKQLYQQEVDKYLQDGKLDAKETADLSKLSVELCISETDASSIIEQRSKRFCPHCGQVLQTEDE